MILIMEIIIVFKCIKYTEKLEQYENLYIRNDLFLYKINFIYINWIMYNPISYSTNLFLTNDFLKRENLDYYQ